jgi:hypothetical protein
MADVRLAAAHDASPLLRTYSGTVTLRQPLPWDASRDTELAEAIRVTTAWYYRSLNSENWFGVGRSADAGSEFAVEWDTTLLPNGRYEVISLLQLVTGDGYGEKTVARPIATEVVVKN